MKIAFLGTGLMGAPMVRNLLKAGFGVTAWNRTQEKASALIGDGATVAQNVTDAVKNAELVITMLSDGDAVGEIISTPGFVERMKAGTIFIDMSSIKPAQARAHSARLASHGVSHIDAPVSGGTKGATDGTLAIMAGGEEPAFERAKPVLSAMGRPVRVGPSGSGQLAKLANQAIVATTIGAVAEAILLMKTGGADLERFREALKGGFADSIILQQHGRRMAQEDFVPGGRSKLQLKDLNNMLEEAAALGLNLPLVDLQQHRFHTLVNDLDGADLDHSALYLELIDRQKDSG